MTMKPLLPIALTEAEYLALSEAVAYLDTMLEQDGWAGEAAESRNVVKMRRTLDRAWAKIYTAWHGRPGGQA